MFVKKLRTKFTVSGQSVLLALKRVTTSELNRLERLSMKKSFKLQEFQQQAKEMESEGWPFNGPFFLGYSFVLYE